MKDNRLLNNFLLYVGPVALIFLVASIEYDLKIATNLVVKLTAFVLSMMLPITLAARITAHDYEQLIESVRMLNLKYSLAVFLLVQVMLFFAGFYTVQVYILTTGAALFFVVTLIFFSVKKLK